MLRGIDKRNIFLDDEDRMKFIEKIKKAMLVGKFELFGYCFMDNHIHPGFPTFITRSGMLCPYL